MKRFLLFSAGFCLILSACNTPITYFGDKLSPTNSVDIYYSAHDVKREYKVIGHLTCPNYIHQETVMKKLSAYSKTIGADAIVILGTAAVKDSQAAVVNADALKYADK
ncbi:hypothetical protein ACFGVS_16205 [Mucilaginibacter sp. AW1-7]|uniref:hypothetical protein n=1 Tax=Mucilaginibacter sp. AW1-7 TaxID=3349874 RepID=UPI003F736645